MLMNAEREQVDVTIIVLTHLDRTTVCAPWGISYKQTNDPVWKVQKCLWTKMLD